MQTEPFFRSQVLKELGIEDPLLNVAQELEKVPRLPSREIYGSKRCEKNVVVFLPLGDPQNYEKLRFYTPEIWVIIPKDWFLPIILAGNWLLFEAIQQP